jgi:transposase
LAEGVGCANASFSGGDRAQNRPVCSRARDVAYYSETGRPSIDPELMIRMLIVGYSFGIRSERRLCDEVHLNLAYRWFCRLGLDGDVPDHSTFPRTATAVFARAIFCASCSRPL